MKQQIFLSCLIAAFLVLSFAAEVSAITGRLGNSRMILRLDEGESVRRSISIENINDVPLTIDILVSGDLAESVELEENGFDLQPGETKNVFFTITASKTGTTETKLNVRFEQPSGGGVGLSANIIVITSGESDEEVDEEGSVVEDDGSSVDVDPSNGDSNVPSANEEFKMSPINILILSTVLLIIIFIALVVYSNKMREKRSRRPRA